MAKRDEPATKGDLEDLANSFKGGIGDLIDKVTGGGDNAPPKKEEAPSSDDGDGEGILDAVFSKSWWGDRAAG